MSAYDPGLGRYTCSQAPHPGIEFYGYGGCAECGYTPVTEAAIEYMESLSPLGPNTDEDIMRAFMAGVDSVTGKGTPSAAVAQELAELNANLRGQRS